MHTVKKRQLSDSRFNMTLPDERYRAIKWAEQFLEDLMDPAKTPRVPKTVRQQARSILKHFPGSFYIDRLAEARPDIITPRMEELHRFIRSAERDPEVTAPIQGEDGDPRL